MDNNILASDYGVGQLAELSQTDYKIDLNQGMDARLVTAPVADIIAAVKWLRFIRFSYDSDGQIGAIMDAAALLAERGIKPYRLFIYLLVTKDIESAARRVDRLKTLRGINLYAPTGRVASCQTRHSLNLHNGMSTEEVIKKKHGGNIADEKTLHGVLRIEKDSPVHHKAGLALCAGLLPCQ